MAKTGKELERRVAQAYRDMGARKVEHNVELAGHQIDVYVELETQDRAMHRIAVEVKDHIRPVGIQIVRDYSVTVDRLRRERLIDEGVIVSAIGFSRQARAAARRGEIRLRMALDRCNLWQDADHVSLKQLWEYFARYAYLPRLRDHDVLLGAVQDGIGQLTWRENFAYAEDWDDDRQRYLNLKAGQAGSVIMDSHSLLVRPEAAERQLEREREVHKPPVVKPGDDEQIPDEETGTGRDEGGEPPVEKKLRRFYGTVDLDTVRMTSEAGSIADAVVQHLSSLVGADITVTVEIQARLPGGAPDRVVRTVTENARTLKFTQFGFEEE